MNKQLSENPAENLSREKAPIESDNFVKVVAVTAATIFLFAIITFKSYLEKPWQRWQLFQAVKSGETAELKELVSKTQASQEEMINIAITNGRLETLSYLISLEPPPDSEKIKQMMEKAIDSFRPEVLETWLKSWAEGNPDAARWAGSMLYRAAAGNTGYSSAPSEEKRRISVIKQLIEINALNELTQEDRQKILAEARFAEIKPLFETEVEKRNE
ncbi:MAG: hypothetical protein ACOYXC_18940 [Candidatus Rifleibacteriota bacterium]